MSIPGNVELGMYPGQQQEHQTLSMKISSVIPLRKRRSPVFHPCSPPREEKNSALGELDLKNKEESNVQDGVTSSSEANNTASLVKSDARKTSVEDVKIEFTPLKSADKDFLASMSVEAKPITSLGPLEDLGNKKVLLQNEKNSEHEVPSSVIPLKKRRFTVFHPCSPPREEKSLASEDLSSKKEEEFNIQAGGTLSSEANNTASLIKWDVTEKFILQNEKSSEPEAPDSSIIAQTADVKQEIVCGQTDCTSRHELPGGKMNVKLSLGPIESDFVALQQQNEIAPCKSNKLDSLLSLALHEEKLVLCDKKQDIAMDSVSNPVSPKRSNWDLNTTMDVWEGSTCSDAVAHRIVNFGGFNKTDSCHDDESLLTIDSTARHTSSSSKFSIQQFKMDDSLVLKLAMPYVDTSKEPFSLSDKLHFTAAKPNLSLKRVDLSKIVKSEPFDDDSKHDCSIGSSSSSNMGSLKLSSMNRDCAKKQRLETMLQSTVSPDKLDGHRSIKSEVVQKHREETCKSIDAVALSAERVMQHQDSCAFSSAYAMPVSLLSQGTSPARSPPCSKITATGDFANLSEQSFSSKEFQCNDIPNKATAISVCLDSNQSRQGKLGISSFVRRIELPQIDEHTVESYQNAGVSGNVEEKMDTVTKMLEESLGSDTGEKENEDIEDGEVREHVLYSADIDPVVEGKKNDSVELVRSAPQNLQLSISSAWQSIGASVFSEKDVEANHDETHGDLIKYHVGVCYDNLQEQHEVSDPYGQVDESPREELSCFIPTDESHCFGVEIGGETTAEVVKEICSGEDNLTSAKVEECLYSEDVAKDFSNSGNKSRIINLSRPSALAASYKSKSISNRFLTSRTGKERYSDYDEEMQTRGNSRKGFYTGGSNKFVKDQSVRNSRPTFMRGKGRGYGRFGSSRGDWDSDPNFASESSYGQSDYRAIRRKYAPSIPDADLDRNGYSFPQDNSFSGNRRKTMNNEFLSPLCGSLRRVSSGDRDGFNTRGYQMLHRIPRNMSPRRCSGELDNNGNFRGNGNGNFSAPTMQRKGYRRLCSKSPVRSRTRSPGPWSSPRRRCLDELPEHSQRRSPALYRMGRVRSNDHNACFPDDMVPRRRGSPSYAPRISKDLGDVDSEREHIERRAVDSNRRVFFARSNRRADALDLRELDDGNEFFNGPSHSNRFHELHGDSNIDNGRRFKERRGPKRLFRPNFNDNNDNFRFHHPNNGPRPSNRFWQHSDSEFVKRSNASQKGEFDFVEGNAEEREFERRGDFVERSSAQEREMEFVERSNAEEMEYREREREFVEGSNAQEMGFDGQIKHWEMEGR